MNTIVFNKLSGAVLFEDGGAPERERGGRPYSSVLDSPHARPEVGIPDGPPLKDNLGLRHRRTGYAHSRGEGTVSCAGVPLQRGRVGGKGPGVPWVCRSASPGLARSHVNGLLSDNMRDQFVGAAPKSLVETEGARSCPSVLAAWTSDLGVICPSPDCGCRCAAEGEEKGLSWVQRNRRSQVVGESRLRLRGLLFGHPSPSPGPRGSPGPRSREGRLPAGSPRRARGSAGPAANPEGEAPGLRGRLWVKQGEGDAGGRQLAGRPAAQTAGEWRAGYARPDPGGLPDAPLGKGGSPGRLHLNDYISCLFCGVAA